MCVMRKYMPGASVITKPAPWRVMHPSLESYIESASVHKARQYVGTRLTRDPRRRVCQIWFQLPAKAYTRSDMLDKVGFGYENNHVSAGALVEG